MKALLTKFLKAFGPSGYETGITRAIREAVTPLVDEIRTDALGNLICVKKGAGRRVMLAAHMDQIGYVVTDYDDKGFLRVSQVGWPRRAHALNRRFVFENGVEGVLSYEVEGFNPADTTSQALFLDIGAASREEARAAVSIGDMAVYAYEEADLLNGCVAAPAMDDRAGCAMLVETLKRLKDCPNEVVAVFTTQEEVGLRGAGASAYDVEPDVAVAIDVTPAGDTPKGEKLPVAVGGGIAVKIMDTSVICAPDVVRALEAAATRAGAKMQREVLTRGGTDAGTIHISRGGVPSGVLSIPCRYVHSAVEVVSLNDMEAGVALLTAFLGEPWPGRA